MEPPLERTPWSELPERLERLAAAMRAVDETVEARGDELRAAADRALDRAAELERALSDALAAAHEARDALARAAPAASAPAASAPAASAPAARAEARRPPPAARPDASLEEARLVAIEMAVAGRSRAEVETHLRAAFALPDTEALIDDVFGERPRHRAGSL